MKEKEGCKKGNETLGCIIWLHVLHCYCWFILIVVLSEQEEGSH